MSDTRDVDANHASINGSVPDGVKGWSWGAFLLNWVWAIGNKTWIGLLSLIPYAGIVMMIILGVKGREWAWKNKQWESLEQFNQVQRKWSIWGGIISGVVFVAAMLVAIAIPAYHDYTLRMDEENLSQPSQNAVVESNPQLASQSISEQDQEVEPEPEPVVQESGPYPLPRLTFGKIELLAAMKQVGIDQGWESEFISYLNKPQVFWDQCIELGTNSAQAGGNMNPVDAKYSAQQSCQRTTMVYHQCLNGTSIDDAIMCLKQHINEVQGGPVIN